MNFATIYGQGARALSEQLKIPRAEAQRYIEAFFGHYSGVRRWRDQVVIEAYEAGFVSLAHGDAELDETLAAAERALAAAAAVR